MPFQPVPAGAESQVRFPPVAGRATQETRRYGRDRRRAWRRAGCPGVRSTARPRAGGPRAPDARAGTRAGVRAASRTGGRSASGTTVPCASTISAVTKTSERPSAGRDVRSAVRRTACAGPAVRRTSAATASRPAGPPPSAPRARRAPSSAGVRGRLGGVGGRGGGDVRQRSGRRGRGGGGETDRRVTVMAALSRQGPEVLVTDREPTDSDGLPHAVVKGPERRDRSGGHIVRISPLTVFDRPVRRTPAEAPGSAGSGPGGRRTRFAAVPEALRWNTRGATCSL